MQKNTRSAAQKDRAESWQALLTCKVAAKGATKTATKLNGTPKLPIRAEEYTTARATVAPLDHNACGPNIKV